MIRRDLVQESGRPCWMLISQLDHAHLAAELAEQWGSSPFAPLSPRDSLIAAIHHHDDGWSDWERQPKVDRTTGIPLAFNELPVEESLAIWRGSITAARNLGPLEGYVVAGHFRALLERFDSWRWQGAAQIQAAEEFLVETGRKMTSWLAGWQACDQSTSDAGSREQVAQLGLAQLQFFDALSLWLCTADRTEPQPFRLANGPIVEFKPLDSERIQISPWPLSVEELGLQVSGRVVERAHYADSDALAAAAGRSHTVLWRLVR